MNEDGEMRGQKEKIGMPMSQKYPTDCCLFSPFSTLTFLCRDSIGDQTSLMQMHRGDSLLFGWSDVAHRGGVGGFIVSETIGRYYCCVTCLDLAEAN